MNLKMESKILFCLSTAMLLTDMGEIKLTVPITSPFKEYSILPTT